MERRSSMNNYKRILWIIFIVLVTFVVLRSIIR